MIIWFHTASVINIHSLYSKLYERGSLVSILLEPFSSFEFNIHVLTKSLVLLSAFLQIT